MEGVREHTCGSGHARDIDGAQGLIYKGYSAIDMKGHMPCTWNKIDNCSLGAVAPHELRCNFTLAWWHDGIDCAVYESHGHARGQHVENRRPVPERKRSFFVKVEC